MTKEIPPTYLTMMFQASYELNPNSDGKPSPIIVRLYELKKEALFQDSDFFDLYDNDLKILATDLISRNELEFRPGEDRTIKYELDPATRFIALIAAYRDLDSAQWRVSTKVAQQMTNTFIVNLEREKITLSGTPTPIEEEMPEIKAPEAKVPEVKVPEIQIPDTPTVEIK
ncbi:MAG: type VI secretion system lipoprotein TssJ [Candidatus Polarisedimenticolaceae bacterium]|nr:type VI secretion system lipoprotein TssJ [Candidatus Polarisedimenticolaceae bacterium]